MGELKSLPLKYRYRTGKDNLIRDFFTPCLSVAVNYKRAVGFFSTSCLISLARGMKDFIKNGGVMQVIASPKLSPQDIEAIKKGYSLRDIIEKNCVAVVESLEWSTGTEAIAWLIANKRFDIKIAKKSQNETLGIYHEKIGIIKDDSGDFITFSGSINESITAHEFNFESFDIDMSWNDIRGLAAEKYQEFEDLWNNKTLGLSIYDFPEAAKQKILEMRKFDSEQEFIEYFDGDPFKKIEFVSIPKTDFPQISSKIKIRDYQKDAIVNWFKNNCKGVFKMATGTGKTITALVAVVKLIEAYRKKNTPLAIIIVCPYRHLVTQWSEECDNFGLRTMKCFSSRHIWLNAATTEALALNCSEHKYSCFITTNATFAKDSFKSTISKISSDILLVVDEAHNVGSSKQIEALPQKAKLRLALSATPERWYDEEGTEALFDYFGKPVIEFGLKEALENGFLTPYNYHPQIVEFTTQESWEYNEISKTLGRLMSKDESKRTRQENDLIMNLLIKRARIQASAFNKTQRLFELMKDYLDDSHILIYCGDSYVEDEIDETTTKQTELVISTLGREMGMKVHSFTAQEGMDLREELKTRFADGDLQVLVAIRCLDEGVDIPATKTAFIIASSTNPRQFIQRRGRVLRNSKDTGKKVANIYDFVVVPSKEDLSNGAFDVERSLIRKELQRVNEFAELALNRAQAQSKFTELKDRYNLLDI